MDTPQDNRTPLQSYIERIERLNEEKAELQKDIGEVFKEAANNGFDKKAMREILRLRKMEKAERENFEAIVEVYKSQLGMLADLPLGQAAIERVA